METNRILIHTYREDGNDFIGYIGEEKILVDPFVTCLWAQEGEMVTEKHIEWAQRREGFYYKFIGHWGMPHNGLRVFLPHSIVSDSLLQS